MHDGQVANTGMVMEVDLQQQLESQKQNQTEVEENEDKDKDKDNNKNRDKCENGDEDKYKDTIGQELGSGHFKLQSKQLGKVQTVQEIQVEHQHDHAFTSFHHRLNKFQTARVLN